jgi:hypothetical protein
MMSWITPTDESNITVTDSTVIHVEHDHDYGDGARPAVFGAVHGAPGEWAPVQQLAQIYTITNSCLALSALG